MGHSLSRIAEELVRAGNGESVRWQGLTLRSHLQPIYSVRQVGCIGFEAVVSDEVMPELTGTQLAIELRKLNPTLPILIASGYGGSGFETRALSAGVNRVIKKPYRMSEIAEILDGFFPSGG